jgi:hypothetical protein
MPAPLTRRLITALALTCATVVPAAVVSSPAALIAAPPAQAATTTVAKQGSTGSTVRTIQRVVGAEVDGQYGPRTAAAVRAWQQKSGLSATGVVDSATWAKMKPYIAVAGAPLTGVDISWPQCPKGMGIPSRPTEGKPMPKASTKFVIVGLTNGPGFHPNPCLAAQVRWIKDHHVYAAPYAFTTYPTSSQLRRYGTSGPYRGTSTRTKLKNAGYAEARFNVASMKKHGLTAPFIWVDVEPSRAPTPWPSNRTNNKAVFDGVLRAYRDAGMKVGFYTTTYGWSTILGSARYGLPEWRTVGGISKAAALRKCSSRSIQGGKAVLAQWWVDDSNTSNSTDYDVMCPGNSTPAKLKLYFHRY